jgi:multidrug efflux pump
VFISGVVALTLSPVMSSKLLDAGREEHGLTGRINRGFDRFRRAYGRVLDATLSARPAVYIVWLVLGLLSIPLLRPCAQRTRARGGPGLRDGHCRSSGGCDD